MKIKQCKPMAPFQACLGGNIFAPTVAWCNQVIVSNKPLKARGFIAAR
ncbi:hypothetical protein [Massilia sp. S19_KUP03_FR1]